MAMVELVNEDSYFFWTFKPYESIPETQMEILEQQFANWLTAKYGALQKARDAWSNSPNPNSQQVRGDAPETGRVGILPPGEIVAQRDSRRAQDTAAFLADSQQRFSRGRSPSCAVTSATKA